MDSMKKGEITVSLCPFFPLSLLSFTYYWEDSFTAAFQWIYFNGGKQIVGDDVYLISLSSAH